MWRVGSPCPWPRGTQQKREVSVMFTASLATPWFGFRQFVSTSSNPGSRACRRSISVRASPWPPWPPNHSTGRVCGEGRAAKVRRPRRRRVHRVAARAGRRDCAPRELQLRHGARRRAQRSRVAACCAIELAEHARASEMLVAVGGQPADARRPPGSRRRRMDRATEQRRATVPPRPRARRPGGAAAAQLQAAATLSEGKLREDARGGPRASSASPCWSRPCTSTR